MLKRNKMVVAVVAFCFAFSLSVCSLSQASVIYWGLPTMYSQGTGNFLTGALSNMTARGYGAYAFTDYASSWGMNNPVVPGNFGPGFGLGLANLSTWQQMYSLASTYGYNPAVYNNPWINYSTFPYTTGYTFPSFSLFTPSYLPLNRYNPYNLGSNLSPWTAPSSPVLSAPATTTATTTTITTP